MADSYKNIHIISTTFQDRYLNLFLITGKKSVLVDCGFASTPNDVIFPYLKRIDFRPSHIHWLVITHASPDHYGGMSVLKRNIPDIQIVAHSREAGAISVAKQFVSEHINIFEEYGFSIPYPAPDSEEFLNLHGNMLPVDLSVNGGEDLALSEDWKLRLFHAPGHTPGHLMVYDPVNEALFAGDALMGKGVPDIAGNLIMPPHYFEVDWYLETIEHALGLQPKYLFLTHYPILAGNEVIDFLFQCKEFVDRCEKLVGNILSSSSKPLKMSHRIEKLRLEIGIPGADYQYALLMRAHLRKLVNQGEVFGAGVYDDRPRPVNGEASLEFDKEVR